LIIKQRREKMKLIDLNRIKAQHYTITTVPDKYSEVFYSDDYKYDNGYFRELEELEDYCYGENEPMPSYIWGTEVTPPELNARDIVKLALGGMYEDASVWINDKALERLQIAMDKFYEEHGDNLTSYCVNYNICIDL